MRRAFQWDLGRQVERLDWLMAQLPRYAAWGYQELYLHLENAVEYPSLPGVARADAYSYRQFARLVEAAARAGLAVVPIVNLLGHTQYLLDVPALRELNERRAADGSPLAEGQICPLHPRTLEVAERLLRDMAPFCTGGKIHVGLDESYHLGQHPLSRAEIAASGLPAHFAGHVGRLHGLAGGLGLRLGMWADMLALLPEAIPLLPPDIVAYDWYYYPFGRRPRLEVHNFAAYDLAPALRARGIEYWGCPMNGAFRYEPLPIFGERLGNIASWWRRCRQTGAAGLLVTSWEGNRLAAEMPMTVDAAAAGLWLEGEEDPGRLLAGGCRRMFGPKRVGGKKEEAARQKEGAAIAQVLLAADKFPFSGYPRWRINERWDTVLTDEPLAPWRAEARACRALALRPGVPPAVRASLRFRAYLAERDLFVRQAGQGIWRMRRAEAQGRIAQARRLRNELTRAAIAFRRQLTVGQAAARAMWRRTRNARVTGPNEQMLKEDAIKLLALRWGDVSPRRPQSRRSRDCTLGGRSPFGAPGRRGDTSPHPRTSIIAGPWQLLFTLTNFAPALQQAVVEMRAPSGAWEDLFGLFAIEFQAAAARPRARRAHRVSVPIEWDGAPADFPLLRLAVRGFGRLRFSDLILTDGAESYRLKIGPRQRGGLVLGTPAPRRGYPDFNWKKNRGEHTLDLRHAEHHRSAQVVRLARR
jgi:hypothetical protein